MSDSDLRRIRARRLTLSLVGFVIFALLMAVITQIDGMWFRAAVAGVAGGFFGVALSALNQLQRSP